MKVLVVEDDIEIATYVAKALKEAGHIVDQTHDGKDALFLSTTEKYDVIVLDRMLPNVDGLTILKVLRESKNDTPVLFLSALAEVDQKVVGLRAGADDYLEKPFSVIELQARLEVLNRRSKHTYNNDTLLQIDDLQLDLNSRKVTRSGHTISLQTKEFQLLAYLMENKGQVVTRSMLFEKVWDYYFDPATNVIDVHMSRLRAKIDKGHEKKLLQTARGSGYFIDG
ncbi:response regulator transcription factor [Thalassotalea marina]|uniref:DNA-binding response regulator n=1 Tax=Thalassotalea marina TaxID=1673741 RepID=A0A919BMC9_9GAMM|nr:response regulator transcription factor [Thalassotalea marina]GHG00225.1 DNA-binding response regulator [Thalassotalea marina]